jgi:hypothetical protein
MKANRVEYDQRMEELEKMEYPKPNKDFICNTFNTFSAKHPWVGRENIRLKSIAREMFEKFSTFPEYVKDYDLQRVEGLLLRYISDVYKTLTQAVPDAFKTEEVLEVQNFFRIMVHQVDKSLVEEWESLKEEPGTTPDPQAPRAPPSLADNPKLLRARIRQEVHRLVKALSQKDWEDAALCLSEDTRAEWPPEKLDAALQPYFEDHPVLRMDHDARSPRLTLVTENAPRVWNVRQTLLDPEGEGLWFLDLVVDLTVKTGAEGPLLHLRRLGT